MRIPWRGLSLALLQVAIVASLGGKLLYDRAHYPRVWVRAVPVDRNQPIRGRYLQLGVVVDAGAFPDDDFKPVPMAGEETAARPRVERRQRRPAMLGLERGKLVARPVTNRRDSNTYVALWRDETGAWAQLVAPLAFFIPEHIKDASILKEEKALWVEVTVTPSGDLRPLRLGVNKNGRMTPLQD